MQKQVVVLTFALLLGCADLFAAGWVAFIAPDIAQGRSLFEEFRKQTAPDLQAQGLEIRFVGVENVPDSPATEATIAAAIERKPRLILAAAERMATIAKRHTRTIPIIFYSAINPVRAGLVESFARPGGNVTGFTTDVEIDRKQLELLREVVPRVRVVGVLNDGTWHPDRVTADQVARYERELNISLRIFTGIEADDMARIVAAESQRVDAWLVPVHNLTGMAREGVVKAINASGRPAVYGRTFFVELGGLMSYQEVIMQPMTIWAEMFRIILAGTSPGQIPVRQPREFELALNIGTASRSGIAFSPGLLRRADKVVGRAGDR